MVEHTHVELGEHQRGEHGRQQGEHQRALDADPDGVAQLIGDLPVARVRVWDAAHELSSCNAGKQRAEQSKVVELNQQGLARGCDAEVLDVCQPSIYVGRTRGISRWSRQSGGVVL